MADEWIPDEPLPNQKPPSSGSVTTTIVTWAILVGMFVVIYSMFGSAKPSSPSPGYPGYWIWIAGGIGLALPILFFLRQVSGTKKFNQSQAPALEALAQNKPQLAADLFAQLARKNRTRPVPHAIATYNHGYALLRAGESAKAVGVLLRVERTPKLQVSNIRTMTPIALARSYALGGDTAKASTWLETAKSRPDLDNPIYGRALLASVEALVRCREGKYDAALAVLEANWPLLEHDLSLDLMAEPWLLRAFAIAMQSSVRDAAAAEPWLRALRILPAEQSRWLTHHWPELAHFATTHDLLRARPTAPAAPMTAGESAPAAPTEPASADAVADSTPTA